jgi:hypothetical protein
LDAGSPPATAGPADQRRLSFFFRFFLAFLTSLTRLLSRIVGAGSNWATVTLTVALPLRVSRFPRG